MSSTRKGPAAGHRWSARGAATILEKADPDTDVRRVARWISRLEAEGLL